ncbi:MAG TPA: hypothetical protein VLK22_03380 [Candidatus Udaeobacter sp.]|nr:hypothetical protein [Candidatus Udaeobacter sp.]
MESGLTKKIIIRVSSLSVLAALITFGIFLPMLSYIKKTANESYKLRTLLEQRYEEASNSRATQKKLEEVKSSVADFYPFLFKPGEELKLITYLESLSAKHNLTQTINNSTLDKTTSKQTTNITMTLVGSYTDTLKYLSDLESSNYFIYIKQFQFTPVYSRNGETQPTANLNLTIELYVN